MDKKEFEEWKRKGNIHFQNGDFSAAVECYSKGLEIENSYVLLGNRSACYIAMKQFDLAIHDAKLSIEADRAYVKGYFRLASALKGAGLLAESVNAAKMGLRLDPENTALRKLSDATVSSRSCKSESLDSSITSVELAILRHLRSLIARIEKGEFDSNSGSQHMLEGSFSELCSSTSSFRETLFPGLATDELSCLPSTMRQLLRWRNVGDILIQQLHAIAKSAARILEGVRARGAARGDIMDSTTEAVLIPQIAQESFGREIIAVVRDVNKKAAGENIRNNPSLAILPAGIKMDNQFDQTVIDTLFRTEGVAIQDYMFGKELSRIVLSDVSRYSRDEKMSEVKFSHFVSTPSSGKKLVTSDRADMAWLDIDSVEVYYPALAFVLRRLYQLPYELNARSSLQMGLLVPSKGVAMLLRVPKFCEQSFRFDNVIRDTDSGLRLSCAYCMVPSEDGLSDPILAPAAYTFRTHASDDSTDVEILNDRSLSTALIVYHSVRDRNSRTQARREYFLILYYIYATPTAEDGSTMLSKQTND